MLRPTSRRLTWPLTYRHLMAESEGLIDHTVRVGSPDQKALLRPLTDDIRTYCLWERRHSTLMQSVAESGSRPEQIRDLSDVIISMIHQGALFQYLREKSVRGRDREILIKAFHPWCDYGQAVIEEHNHYIRAHSSSLCARYLAMKLGDEHVRDWFGTYQTLFTRYFELFCDTVIAQGTGRALTYEPLLREHKALVMAERRRILDRVTRPGSWRTSLVPQALGIKQRRFS